MTARFRRALDSHYRVLADLKHSREEIRAALHEWSKQETQKKAAGELGVSVAFVNEVIRGKKEWGANRGATRGL